MSRPSKLSRIAARNSSRAACRRIALTCRVAKTIERATVAFELPLLLAVPTFRNRK